MYISNLDDDFSEEDMSKLFAKFGNVIGAKVFKDKEGERSNDFALVVFSSREEANKAVTKMNGHVLVSKPLCVEFAHPKQKRIDCEEKQVACTNPIRTHIEEVAYRRILTMYPDMAGQWIGTLPEMDNSELLQMFNMPESERRKVEEAINLIDKD